jgi:hypothetical protein
MLSAVRTAVAMLPLAVSIFGAPVPMRPRPTCAIVRTQRGESDSDFDPREVIRGQIVLTVPLSGANEGYRTLNGRFHLN